MRAAAIAGFVMLAVSACGVKADGPPHIEVDRTPCAQCGMLISEPVFAAAYRGPGAEARAFDDIGCLLESMSREPDARAVRFWFHDADSQEWIDGPSAVFVHSDRIRTPMAGGMLAYADPASAERGALAHDGQIIAAVDDLLAQRPRPERGAGGPRGEAAAPSGRERGWGPASTGKRGQK